MNPDSVANPAALDAALEYLEMGYSPVPVCHPTHHVVSEDHIETCDNPGKRPLVNWREFQNTPAPAAVLRKWWARWPNALVGILTGPGTGCFGVDIDTDKGGQRSLDELALLGSLLPETGPVDSTPGGGRHVWFKHPGRIVKTAAKFWQGVDFRGDGGMLVVPPAPGREWVNPLVVPGELRDAPPWILRASDDAMEHTGKSLEPDELTDLLWGHYYEGQRADTFVRVVGHLKNSHAERRARAMALRWAEEQCHPPYEDAEDQFDRMWEHFAASGGKSGRRRPTEPETLDAILARKDEGDPIIPSLLYPGDVTTIFAMSGQGKSIFALNMMADLSNGTPLLGVWPAPKKKQRVWYLDAEMSLGELQERLRTFRQQFTDLAYIRASNETVNLEDRPSESWNWLDAMLGEWSPDVLIVDNLATVCGKLEQNSNTAMRWIVDELRDLGKQHHMGVILVAHAGKESRQVDGTLVKATPRGASAIQDASAILIGVDNAGSRFLRRATLIKTRSTTATREIVVRDPLFKYDPDTLLVAQVKGSDDPLEPGEVDRILGELQRRGWGYREIATKTGIGRSTISDWKTGKQRPTPALLAQLRELHDEVAGVQRGTDDADPVGLG